MAAKYVLVAALMAFARVASTGEYCVSNAAQLTAALTSAASDPDAVASIKVEAGEYPGNFVYASTVSGQNSPAIELTGGWLNGCASQGGERPHISGTLTLTGIDYAFYPIVVSQLSVDGQLFTRTFGSVTVSDSRVNGGGIDVGCCTSAIIFERNMIAGQNAQFVTAGSYTSSVIRNNVFTGLNSFYIDNESQGDRFTIRGNTILFMPSQFVVGIELATTSDTTTIEFGRNLIASANGVWPYGGGLINFNLDENNNHLYPPINVFDNWIATGQYNLVQDALWAFAGNGNVVSQFALPFVSAVPPYNLHLLSGSPMIDYSLPIAADVGDTDLDGNPRMFDGKVDVGAYEQQGIFKNGFDP
jgi:hypothetical protein